MTAHESSYGAGHTRAAAVITGAAAVMMAAALVAGVATGRMWWLVKPSYGPILLATAAVLCVLGLLRIASGVRRDGAAAPESFAALLTVIAAALVAVGAVGPATGALASGKPLFAAAGAPAVRYAALPAPPEVPYVPLYQVVGRLAAGDGSLDGGREIRVIGQVTRAGGGWQLVRMQMNCCAADTLLTAIAGVGAPPATDGAWVDATAQAFTAGKGEPRLRVVAAKVTGPPRTAYEF